MSTTTHAVKPLSEQSDPKSQRTRRFWYALGLAALLLLVVAGAALAVRGRLDPGEPVTGISEVAVRDNEFSPAAVEVPTGTTVTWRWEGGEAHNVVGDGWEAPVQASGEFARAFAEPGTYGYQCTLHFLMSGEVVVTG